MAFIIISCLSLAWIGIIIIGFLFDLLQQQKKKKAFQKRFHRPL